MQSCRRSFAMSRGGRSLRGDGAGVGVRRSRCAEVGAPVLPHKGSIELAGVRDEGSSSGLPVTEMREGGI